jgi:hypothetical protein
MQMALEALEKVTKHFTRTPSTLMDSEARGEAHNAITALRQALETEQESVRLQCTTCGTVYADGLPPQVAQPEQEPVAWIHDGGKGELWWHRSSKFDEEGTLIGYNPDDVPLYTAPQPALKTKYKQARSLTDELMDCVDRLGSEADTVDPRVWHHLLVYAPKKEWVGLTDDEIQDLSYLSEKCDASNSEWFDRWGFARAIEAKLKEKNKW